jgi:hypothetical protein
MSCRTPLAGVLALVTLGVASVPMYAQGFEIGARLGPSITNLEGAGDRDSKSGFTIVGFAGYRLGDLAMILGELSFVRKGFMNEKIEVGTLCNGDSCNLIVDRSLELEYLQLQVPIAVVIPTGSSRLMYAPIPG